MFTSYRSLVVLNYFPKWGCKELFVWALAVSNRVYVPYTCLRHVSRGTVHLLFTYQIWLNVLRRGISRGAHLYFIFFFRGGHFFYCEHSLSWKKKIFPNEHTNIPKIFSYLFLSPTFLRKKTALALLSPLSKAPGLYSCSSKPLVAARQDLAVARRNSHSSSLIRTTQLR